MRGHLIHPGPAALAGLRPGLAGTRRAGRLAAHIAGCARCARVCAQLDAVSAALWADSPPPLPSDAERRILTALAVEARIAYHPARVRQPYRRHRTAARVLASAVASVIVLGAGIGYVLGAGQAATQGHPSASVLAARTPSGVTAGGSPQAPTTAWPPAGQPGRTPGSLQPDQGAYPAYQQDSSGAWAASFLVSDTGTRYRKSTLRVQVRDILAAQGVAAPVQPATPQDSPAPMIVPASTAPVAVTSAQSPAARTSPEAVPSPSLVGCVLHLTGNISPELVDRATYQSQPAYVIAMPDEAWVVGTNCTAARPSLITSVSLATAG